MSWTMRAAVAVVAAAAVAIIPVARERCAASCEGRAAGAATSTSQEPSCHHSSSSGLRMSHAPQACGHDHDSGAMTVAASSTPIARAEVPAIVANVDPTPMIAPVRPISAPFASPPVDLLPRSLSLSLRI
jgi:hypothetical protein